jgi:dipeptidase
MRIGLFGIRRPARRPDQQLRFLAASLIIFGFVAVQPHDARACYSIAVGKDASSDGAVLAGHDEQNSPQRYTVFSKVPRIEHSPGETVVLDNGVEIPEVETTWAYLWSHIPDQDFSDAYVNEWGVSVFSNYCPSRYVGMDLNEGKIGYWLRRLIAERAKTAREGVELAGDLLEQFGYSDVGRTYVVSDPSEAWVMAVVHGKHWLAERVPDNEVVVIPNVYVIQEVDLEDTENFLSASDIIDFAVEQGWYDSESQEPFRFREAYGDPDASDIRQRQGQTLVTGVEPVVDDGDLPFSVMPSASLSVADAIEHVRAFDIPAQTQEGSVVQLRDWLPVEIGPVYWRTTGSPTFSPLTPWYVGSQDTPDVFCDDAQTAWTAHKELRSHVSSLGADALDFVRGVWDELEARTYEAVPTIDSSAADLMSEDEEAGLSLLTGYSANVALKAVQLALKMTDDWIADPELPVALASGAPAGYPDTLTYSFDGFARVEPGNAVEAYNWDFGDAAAGSGEFVEHRYSEGGQYTVTLTVSDDSGKTDEDTITLDVIGSSDTDSDTDTDGDADTDTDTDTDDGAGVGSEDSGESGCACRADGKSAGLSFLKLFCALIASG